MTIANSIVGQEMAILRSVGASPITIVASLMLIESFIIAVVSVYDSTLLMIVIFYYGQGYIQTN